MTCIIQFWQVCSLYLDKNQLNFSTEPHNDNFFISFSRKKKKTVEMIFQTRYCTFEISAEPFLTNFLSFLAQSPEKLIECKKKSKKTAKFCQNVESNFKNCSIRSLTKILGKNFQSPKMMEKGLKTNTFPELSPVKVDCSVESHSKSLFSKSNEKLTIIREGWNNKTPSEILSSQCSSVQAKKQFFWQPCYQVLPKRKVVRSKSQNLKKN